MWNLLSTLMTGYFAAAAVAIAASASFTEAHTEHLWSIAEQIGRALGGL